MGRLHWTREQKQDFWATFVRHRDEGCSIKEAWSRAYADFRAEGKIAPGLRTFGNWYRAAMAGADGANQVDEVDTVDEVDGAGTEAAGEAAVVAGAEDEAAEAANNRTRRTYRTYKENAGTGAAGEAADAAEPETADDYVRKLEAMVRLYRRRQEADVDAVCDYLLPELFPAEEE